MDRPCHSHRAVRAFRDREVRAGHRRDRRGGDHAHPRLPSAQRNGAGLRQSRADHYRCHVHSVGRADPHRRGRSARKYRGPANQGQAAAIHRRASGRHLRRLVSGQQHARRDHPCPGPQEDRQGRRDNGGAPSYSALLSLDPRRNPHADRHIDESAGRRGRPACGRAGLRDIRAYRSRPYRRCHRHRVSPAHRPFPATRSRGRRSGGRHAGRRALSHRAQDCRGGCGDRQAGQRDRSGQTLGYPARWYRAIGRDHARRFLADHPAGRRQASIGCQSGGTALARSERAVHWACRSRAHRSRARPVSSKRPFRPAIRPWAASCRRYPSLRRRTRGSLASRVPATCRDRTFRRPGFALRTTWLSKARPHASRRWKPT